MWLIRNTSDHDWWYSISATIYLNLTKYNMNQLHIQGMFISMKNVASHINLVALPPSRDFYGYHKHYMQNICVCT